MQDGWLESVEVGHPAADILQYLAHLGRLKHNARLVQNLLDRVDELHLPVGVGLAGLAEELGDDGDVRRLRAHAHQHDDVGVVQALKHLHSAMRGPQKKTRAVNGAAHLHLAFNFV